MAIEGLCKVVVFGAGKIGSPVAQFLARNNNYAVSLADISEAAAAASASGFSITPRLVPGGGGRDEYAAILKGANAVISCLPFDSNPLVAEAAKQSGAHYLDLTEDIETTNAVRAIYEGSGLCAIPQCGLAPGLINILGVHLMTKLDTVETLEMKVGALSRHPSNALDYHVTWSVRGLINEYIRNGVALRDGEVVTTKPLEELRHVYVDGREYEAFNTAGGVADLPQRLRGKVKNLDYQTIRYPGHRDSLKLLLETLGFRNDPEALETRFEKYLRTTDQDVVVIHVKAEGSKDGQPVVVTRGEHIYHQMVDGVHRTGIAITTAGTVCATLDLLRQGVIGGQGIGGIVSQADIPYELLIQSPFMEAYGRQIGIGS